MLRKSHISSTVNEVSSEDKINKAFEANNGADGSSIHEQKGRGHDQYHEQNLGVQSAPWEPGAWRRFPVIPVGSLIIVLACIVATLFILIKSDGKSIGTWGFGVKPSVYISITSVVSNTLLSVALANGLIISFWRTALRGCTLDELNRNWDAGHSALSAVTIGWRKGGRVVALACLFSLIGLIRGPLNQQASDVTSGVPLDTRGIVKFNIAQQLPDGYTGLGVSSRSLNKDTSRLTPTFNQIMKEYTTRSDMDLIYTRCGEFCNTTAKAFGFNTDCRFSDFTVDRDSTALVQDIFVTSTILYQIGEEPTPDNFGWADTGLQLNATYILKLATKEENQTKQANETDQTNNGAPVFVISYRSHICNLTPGTRAYHMELSNGTVTLLGNLSINDSFEKIKLVSPTNLGDQTTIGGFQYAMSYVFDSSATWNFAGPVSSVTLKGSLANEMVIEDHVDSNGLYSFNDPMSLMLDGIHEIAFRASLRAGQDNATITNAAQSENYVGKDYLTVYETNKIYMSVGAALGLLSVIAVSVTLYGWWELGRKMSFSPLEIAKAFDAPLLKHAGSNLHFNDMKFPGLEQRIQYGEIRRGEGAFTSATEGDRNEVVFLGMGEGAEKPRNRKHYGH